MIPVPGIRPVKELLHHNPARVKEVWIARQRTLSRLTDIIAICEKEGIPLYYKHMDEISHLVPDVYHQGVVAIIAEFGHACLEELISRVKRVSERSLILALDHITDEGNLASILRTAAFFGVHGVLIPKNRSVSISPQVIKRSAGGCFYVPVVRVTNMARALKRLKEEGIWIIGTSHKGRVSLYEFDWDRDLVLILGNEEKGIGHAVEKLCDELVSIPVYGKIESLNVGVATGIFLSEITRVRINPS